MRERVIVASPLCGGRRGGNKRVERTRQRGTCEHMANWQASQQSELVVPTKGGRYGMVAMTLSSMAMGVGRQLISSVVRVGFGLPGPAKYSA